MQKFIGLLNYDEREMERMNKRAEQRDLGEQLAESLGGKLTEAYYTLGSTDVVIFGEFPDADTAAQAAFAHDKEIGGELEMIAAYTAEEFDELVEALDQTPE